MAEAVLARKQGDDFQARLFWLYAALLLEPTGNVARVGYETGPKAFDDVLIGYEPARAPQDHAGSLILRDHLQCKWHVRPDEFGYTELIDPAFSGAQAVSFLQRARDAQQQHAPGGLGARFKLVTNWRLRHQDPLMKIVLAQWHALDLDRLFDGKDGSAMGKVRKMWREHLGLDEEALRHVARTLGVTQRLESGEDLRERLNDRFAANGLIRVPNAEAGFFYDDLIAKLHAQGRKQFDRTSFREMCEQEKLFDHYDQRNPVSIGVRSFMHPIDNLEARSDRTLNLVPHFDGRFIRDGAAWNATVFPELQAFVLSASQDVDHLRLILDAHVSLAFGVGAILNMKSGKTVEIEQRTGGRRFWSATDLPFDSDWPILSFEFEHLAPGRNLAVAVSFAHDITKDVRSYVQSLPDVGRILHVRLASGASGRSVICGHHAQLLADALLAKIREEAFAGDPRPTSHIFYAGPNAFAFLLGQKQPALGPVVIYEWDFEGTGHGSYRPGLRLPPLTAP
jgi:SMODS-associated and fused to various effectors sensor domain